MAALGDLGGGADWDFSVPLSLWNLGVTAR
jgi:hypothetical protein